MSEKVSYKPREEFASKDTDFENKIRPGQFDDFGGQADIIEKLKIYVQAAIIRGESLDHILFHGPPGLGKTTLAHIHYM